MLFPATFASTAIVDSFTLVVVHCAGSGFTGFAQWSHLSIYPIPFKGVLNQLKKPEVHKYQQWITYSTNMYSSDDSQRLYGILGEK